MHKFKGDYWSLKGTIEDILTQNESSHYSHLSTKKDNIEDFFTKNELSSTKTVEKYYKKEIKAKED